MKLNKNASYTLIALLQDKTTATEINSWLNMNTPRSTQRALQTLESADLALSKGPLNSPSYKPHYPHVLNRKIATKILEDETRPVSAYNYRLLDFLESAPSNLLDALFEFPDAAADSKITDDRELEHLTIELSWKSSALEGNTYSLLDTELLIKEGRRASGKTDFETQMILNHKNAIDFIRENTELFTKKIKAKTVTELHKIIGYNIGIPSGVRKKVTRITASNYTPEANPHKLQENLHRSLEILGRSKNLYMRSLLALALIPYLQHFEDGNKRTGRLLSNAILISNFGFGYSLRNVDAKELALAYLAFYELNNLAPLAQILIYQLKARSAV